MSWFAFAAGWFVVIFGIINLVRMAFFMVGSDLYTIRMARMRKNTNGFPLPTCTVIIPAHNEELIIRTSLESVINAQYDHDRIHIVVADDGSTDKTAEIVRAVISEHPARRITLISRPNAGKAHALNHALQHETSGELVMCLDADSTIETRALINAARYFTDPRVVALSSNVKIRPTGTFLNLVQQFEYIVSYQMKRAQTFFNIEYIIGGIGSTFRRSALEQVGHYDTNTVTEDIDLTMKLLQLGSKENRAIYGADVVAYTESVLSIGDLIKQRLRWKWGRAQTFEKNWNMFFARDTRHSKSLTWFNLPFAIFSDIAFFLEPLVLGYILYVIAIYHDWATLLTACAIISAYISMNILAEDTIPWKQKARLLVVAPSMYVFFYILSVVEYVALLKTYLRYGAMRKSITTDSCSWEHVARVRV